MSYVIGVARKKDWPGISLARSEAKPMREELVAEIGAAFTCAALGITPTVRHSDYIASWLEVLREDNRAIVRAASQASKASDFLLGFLTGTAGQGAQGEGADGEDVEAEADVAAAA